MKRTITFLGTTYSNPIKPIAPFNYEGTQRYYDYAMDIMQISNVNSKSVEEIRRSVYAQMEECWNTGEDYDATDISRWINQLQKELIALNRVADQVLRNI